MNTLSLLLATLARRIETQPETYLVALAGLPGSGKSTLCNQLQQEDPSIAVLSMDGYHIPRNV